MKPLSSAIAAALILFSAQEGISEAIKKCLDEHYINGIKNAVNPYYKHNVMNNAYKHIKEFLLSNHEQYKDFYDVSFEL